MGLQSTPRRTYVYELNLEEYYLEIEVQLGCKIQANQRNRRSSLSCSHLEVPYGQHTIKHLSGTPPHPGLGTHRAALKALNAGKLPMTSNTT